MKQMKITIKENNVATIHDQLDEQEVGRLPVIVKKIHFLFYSDVEESETYQNAKVEGLLFSLSDWGIIDDIESIETSYDVMYMPGEDYKVEVTITV